MKSSKILFTFADISHRSWYVLTIDTRFGNKTVDFSELIFESVFSVYENKVLQLMSGGASLEKFGEKGLLENLRHQKVILKLTDL